MDDDDPMIGGYFDLDRPDNCALVVAPRKPLSEIYNQVFEAFPELGWYGIFADDVVPETVGWDKALIDAAAADGLAYGDDGISDRPTHFVIGGDLAREIGWLALPGLERLYIDTVWADIAADRGVLRYLPDVKITHWHFSNGKALKDAIYRKPRAAEDKARYAGWKHQHAGDTHA